MPLVLRCNQDRSASVSFHKRNIVSPAILAADLNRAATNCRSIVIPNKSISPGWFSAPASKTVGSRLRGMSFYSFRLCANYSDVILGCAMNRIREKYRRGGSKNAEDREKIVRRPFFSLRTLRLGGEDHSDTEVFRGERFAANRSVA
jgi:hypothetical protein